MKSTVSWPQFKDCESCGKPFEAYRPQHRFCKENGCMKRRANHRWLEWRERQEALGTYRDKVNGWQRDYRQRTGYGRDYELRSKYGITLEEWMRMVENANGVCEICGNADEALCVDHCHETKRVRGVLCRRCNRAIGQLDDDPDLLRRAADYLSSDLG